jgi:hypothetical protein
LIPLRLEHFAPNEILFRAVPNVEHGTLCAAFGLDPVTFWFDVPESFRREGSQRAGLSASRREISGFVFRGPKGSNPVAKLSVCREGDKFRDRDPMSRADFERLGETL